MNATAFGYNLRIEVLLLALFVLKAQAFDLLARYPTTLTNGDYRTQAARPWHFTRDDIFEVSRFSLAMGQDLKVEAGPAVLGVVHCTDGAVGAVVLPHAKAEFASSSVTGTEAISHMWLRFHPMEIDHLFPPDAVSTNATVTRQMELLHIIRQKIRSSCCAGAPDGSVRMLISEPTNIIVDVDTLNGPRRVFVADTKACTAQYSPAFEKKSVRLPPPITSALAAVAFDELWNSFDRDYAMFVLRPEVDWGKLREQYRPKALASQSAFEWAGVCAEMLKPLRDLHVWLRVVGENVPVFNRPFLPNSNPSAHRGILGDLRGGGRPLQWAITSDAIGFIGLYSLDPDSKMKEGFDASLEQMRDTRGLILDVRLNGGGDEPLASELAGRFLNRDFVYAYSQFRNGPLHTNLTEKYERTVGPRGPWRYQRPVVLLIGQVCMSSCESFVAMLSGATNVTIMGDHTRGSSGNPEIIHLPLDMTVGQVERTNNPRREGNSHHAPDASHPTEAQNLPIARAAPQPIETCVGLEILRDRLLAQRTAGQPVEERMHPRQTGREEPVTHEPRDLHTMRMHSRCAASATDSASASAHSVKLSRTHARES